MRREARGRNSDHDRADDWLADEGELNWDDPRRDAPAGRQEASAAAASVNRPISAPTWDSRGRGRLAAGADAIARRRLVAALAGVALIVFAVIGVVVATSGGSSKPGPTAVAPQRSQAPTQPATATPQPATPPTTSTRSAGGAPARTQPTSSSSTLRVTLPAGGALSIGDSGAEVVALQKALAALGLKVGQPDGSFGPTTEAAVVAFQTAHGLIPDGIVGASTARTLNRALAARG